MRVVLTRTFNHTGPGRGEALRRELLRPADRGDRGRLRVRRCLSVGNLDAVRDFTDVRDVVRAYWALLERGEGGDVYNVCGGEGYRIREMLDILLGASTARVDVRVDPERLRPADIPVLVGDPSRLRAATGWEPEIPLERTLTDLLDFWRQKVRSSRARIGARARPLYFGSGSGSGSSPLKISWIAASSRGAVWAASSSTGSSATPMSSSVGSSLSASPSTY